ncbi:MAG: hypothetical protein IPO91_21350 [Chloroflexi bacterium]|nr:hypothetical protein [Chloroflexota bacterium]
MTRTRLILLGLLLVALVARIIPGPRTIDDAFITFRYSRNIVEGSASCTTPACTRSARRRRCSR